MSGYRRVRVNDEVARVLNEALRTVKDPRVAGEMITVTQCDVSGDLKYAKVYFSVLGAEGDKIKEIKKGLYSASGYLRSQIAHTLDMRQTPELTFEYDNAMERGANISELLKKANIKPIEESDLYDDGK